MSDDDWDHALNADALSTVRMARHLGPAMCDRRRRLIVFVTSDNVAQLYFKQTAYNVSKSAVLSFAKSVVMQHSGKGVRVNCMAPLFTETLMTDGMVEQRAMDMECSYDEVVESFLEDQRPSLC